MLVCMHCALYIHFLYICEHMALPHELVGCIHILAHTLDQGLPGSTRRIAGVWVQVGVRVGVCVRR